MKYLALLSILMLSFACSNQPDTPTQENTIIMPNIPKQFDWQGHRGARGLLPENSIPGFLKALEFPVRTLELDVVISRDKQVVVSHEPWMSAEICTHPDGRSAVQPEEAKSLNLYRMDYAQIRLYDCGSRGHTRFPEQLPQPVYKPTLGTVLEEAEAACARMKRPLPYYNIELKAMPEWDQLMTPEPAEFCRLVLEVLKETQVLDRASIQSFDVRILQEMRRQAPDIKLVYLVEHSEGLAADLRRLGFTPAVYSPYFLLLNKALVAQAQQQGMQVIPWTVNEPSQMDSLIRMGVDGIITDYPNRIAPLLNQDGLR